MALTKKQIAVILAIKNKKAGKPSPQKSPLSPANHPPGEAVPSVPVVKVPSIKKESTITVPKASKIVKFPKLRYKMGLK